MKNLKNIIMDLEIISKTTLFCEMGVLVLLSWSIGFPKKKIWPPKSWKTFNFWITWLVIITIFIGLFLIAIEDFNSWILNNKVRYYLGLPLFILGTSITCWAIALMGARNTLGIENKFITIGPYRYSRNPQYIGDILILMGSALFINSSMLFVPSILACIGFRLMPFPEEDWLKERYGVEYIEYYNHITRFI